MIQQDTSSLITAIDEMIAEFDKQKELNPEKHADIYEAFQQSFQYYIEENRLQIAEMIYHSELEKSDKLYFIYLLFNDLFDYSQYQLLQQKFDSLIEGLEMEEKNLQDKIQKLEEQQRLLEQSIYENTPIAHKQFIESQSEIVENGLMKVESGKKKREAKEMESIKQKLNKKSK